MEDKTYEELKNEFIIRAVHLLSNGCYSITMLAIGLNIIKKFSEDKLSFAAVYFLFSVIFAFKFDFQLDKIKDSKILENRHIE